MRVDKARVLLRQFYSGYGHHVLSKTVQYLGITVIGTFAETRYFSLFSRRLHTNT